MLKELITYPQFKYLKILVNECDSRGIEIPNEIMDEIDDCELTRKRAAEIIDELLFEIGR